MRQDLRTARGTLGPVQRFLLREPLRRLDTLLAPAESLLVLAPGWWRGHRGVAVVTTSRLLLVRRAGAGSSRDHVARALGGLGKLHLHASPPDGARLRLPLGPEHEEFSVTMHGARLRHLLRDAVT